MPNGANFESGRTDVHRYDDYIEGWNYLSVPSPRISCASSSQFCMESQCSAASTIMYFRRMYVRHPVLRTSCLRCSRDVNDPEYIEHGTVEPQLCDFPPFPPAHLPDIDPKMEEAQAAQASQHLPAPSSSEPSIMGTPQPGTNPHLHPGKTGHAQVGSHPNPAAAWNNLQPYKGDGSSFDATSSQREVNSKQPLLPQKQPSGTSIASVQEQNHGGPSPTLPMPVIPKPKAQPPPTASAAPQQGAPTPPPQASDAQQDGEAKPQWQAGQEGDVVPAPASHGQAQGEGGLIEALNQYAANGALLFERYVVRGAQDRRFGGQGVVQFAQDPHTQEQYAFPLVYVSQHAS